MNEKANAASDKAELCKDDADPGNALSGQTHEIDIADAKEESESGTCQNLSDGKINVLKFSAVRCIVQHFTVSSLPSLVVSWELFLEHDWIWQAVASVLSTGVNTIQSGILVALVH